MKLQLYTTDIYRLGVTRELKPLRAMEALSLMLSNSADAEYCYTNTVAVYHSVVFCYFDQQDTGRLTKTHISVNFYQFGAKWMEFVEMVKAVEFHL